MIMNPMSVLQHKNMEYPKLNYWLVHSPISSITPSKLELNRSLNFKKNKD